MPTKTEKSDEKASSKTATALTAKGTLPVTVDHLARTEADSESEDDEDEEESDSEQAHSELFGLRIKYFKKDFGIAYSRGDLQVWKHSMHLYN